MTRECTNKIPYAYEILDRARCVVATWTGTRTLEDIMMYLDDLNRHPKFGPDLNTLHDFRASYPDFDSDGSFNLTMRIKQRGGSPSTRTVVFLVSDDMNYGAMRKFMSFSEDTFAEKHVTRDVEAAKKLLNLPDEYVLPADRSTESITVP